MLRYRPARRPSWYVGQRRGNVADEAGSCPTLGKAAALTDPLALMHFNILRCHHQLSSTWLKTKTRIKAVRFDDRAQSYRNLENSWITKQKSKLVPGAMYPPAWNQIWLWRFCLFRWNRRESSGESTGESERIGWDWDWTSPLISLVGLGYQRGWIGPHPQYLTIPPHKQKLRGPLCSSCHTSLFRL